MRRFMADRIPQDVSVLMYVTIAFTLTLNKRYILRLHILLVFVPSAPLLTLVSGLCLGASLISSTLLVYRHEPLEEATATQAVGSLSPALFVGSLYSSS